MIGKLLIFACVALVQSSPEDDGTRKWEPSDRCPKAGVHWLLPHETDCDKFYYCEYGMKYIIPTSCAPGTMFSYKDQVCDWPENVDCGGLSAPSECGKDNENNKNCDNGGSGNGDNETSGGEWLPNGCPADFDVHHLFPHESDCSKFYQCSNGVVYDKDCPAGLHFNPQLQVCDWPADAGCESSGGEGSGDSGNGCGGGGEDGNNGAECGGGGNGGGENGNGCDGSVDNGNGCGGGGNEGGDNGNGCGGGGNGGSNGAECGGGGNEGGDNGNECGGGGGDSGIGCGGDNSGGTLPNGCPADFDVELLLPHESDCGKFYQCANGEAVEMKCPSGTHFNPKKQVCDWPEDAGCESGDGGDNGNGCGDNGNGCGGDNSGGTLPNGCPADFDVELLLPHESDCGKFYQCANGVTVEMKCPSGTHFNPKKQVCDWPEDAGCESSDGGDNGNGCGGGGDNGNECGGSSGGGGDNGNECGGSGNGSGGNGTECGGGSDGGGDNGNECGGGGDGGGDNGNGCGGDNSGGTLPNGCPADFDVEMLLPHESDCGKFYQCANGVTVEMKCPSGTHFNPKKQICDWPENAGCESSDGGDNGNGCGGGGDNGNECGGGGNGGEGNGNECGGGDNGNECGGGGNGGEDNGNGCGGGDGNECGGGGEGGGDNGNGGGDNGNGCGGGGDGSGGNGNECGGGGDGNGGENGDGTLPNGCPADFDENMLLPHESDCGKFYQCVNGEKVEMNCSSGTHFNPKTQECDWPWLAGCEPSDGGEGSGEGGGNGNECGGGDNGNECGGGGNGGEDNGNGCGGGGGNECGGGGDGGGDNGNGGEDNGNGGEDNGNGGEDNGNGCGGGDGNECGGGGDGGGDNGNGGEDNGNGGEDNGNGGEDNGNGGEDNGNGCGGVDGNECGGGGDGGGDNGNGGEDNGNGDGGSGNSNDKCKEDCNVLPWAHESDCDKFWLCNGTKAVLVNCSEGLNFNPATYTCDFACNVNCVRENIQSTAGRDGLKLFVPWDKLDGPIAAWYREINKH